MADIHDYLDASRATDNALSSLRTYAGQIEDAARTPQEASLAVALAADAITCAIRELGTRLDYVLREEMRRASNRFSGS